MFEKILHTLGTRILNAFVNLAVAILISNYLGATGKGEQGIILATISIIVLVTGVIGPSSLIFHIPRFPNGVLIFFSYVWLLISATGIYLLLTFTHIIPDQFILDICILTIILSVTSINLSILIAKQRIKENNRVNNLQTVTILLVLLFLS